MLNQQDQTQQNALDDLFEPFESLLGSSIPANADNYLSLMRYNLDGTVFRFNLGHIRMEMFAFFEEYLSLVEDVRFKEAQFVEMRNDGWVVCH